MGLADNHLLGMPTIDLAHRSQLDEFLAWLADQQRLFGNAPKFVVSSSVFCPNDMSEKARRRPRDGTGRSVYRQRQSPRRQRSVAGFSQYAAGHSRQNRPAWDPECRLPHRRHPLRQYPRASASRRAAPIRESSRTTSPPSAFYMASSCSPTATPITMSTIQGSPISRIRFPIEGGEMNYRAWGFHPEGTISAASTSTSRPRR